MSKFTFIDLFGDGDGLSEGFNQAIFEADTHIEAERTAVIIYL